MKNLSGWTLLAALLAAPATQGCATIAHGRTQKVDVWTDPPGATATAGGQTVHTPGVLILPRKSVEVEVRIEKEGYAPRIVRLQRKESKAIWWNLLAVPVGAAVGGVAGAGNTLDSSSQGKAGMGAIAGVALASGLTFGVDYGTGGAYQLEPARIVVRLEPAAAGLPARSLDHPTAASIPETRW